MEATAAWRYTTGYVLRIEEDSHIDAVRALWNFYPGCESLGLIILNPRYIDRGAVALQQLPGV